MATDAVSDWGNGERARARKRAKENVLDLLEKTKEKKEKLYLSYNV